MGEGGKLRWMRAVMERKKERMVEWERQEVKEGGGTGMEGGELNSLQGRRWDDGVGNLAERGPRWAGRRRGIGWASG